MNNDLKTLFYPFEQNQLSANQFQKTLFFNARVHNSLKDFPDLLTQQFFKPYSDELALSGYQIENDDKKISTTFDLVLILIPKNVTEAKGKIAHGINMLNQNGILICAADNKAGGPRLKQFLTDFGFNIIGEESKNKARVIWAKIPTKNPEIISKAMSDASEQFVEKINFLSIPGIFGWDKIDQGSSLLSSCLPDQLEGIGADFGCGYGYLSKTILQKFQHIKKLYCVDADLRAVHMCEKNCIEYKDKYECIWIDLACPYSNLKNLDFIIMNPPFHEGKTEDTNIGKTFILNASKALRKNGKLYLVANKHLPYEDILKHHFSNVKTLEQKNGFKVFMTCL